MKQSITISPETNNSKRKMKTLIPFQKNCEHCGYKICSFTWYFLLFLIGFLGVFLLMN